MSLARGGALHGAAVLIAKTAAGAVFGGYNPKGWLGMLPTNWFFL